jgi:hypothetical protein
MIEKIMKALVAIEKWALNKCIPKDTVEYEDYYFTIKEHEKELKRIAEESKI